jgi:malate dehydrogenase
MSFIAVLGAGALGGAVACRLATRDRVREVRIVDPHDAVARGKALDILQSAPVDRFSTRLSAHERLEAAAGARAIVVADSAGGEGEYAGESGLAMVRRLTAIETEAPLVFAGAGQRQLIARTVTELHVDPRRVVGSAPAAFESAVRALAALELNGSGCDVQLLVLGAPPEAAVIAWEEATAAGQPLGALVPPHRLRAISAQLPALWPPGPQALASAAAQVVDAIVNGARGRVTAFASLDAPPWRGAVVALPLVLGSRGVARVIQPVLSRQEQTALENARV